MNNQQRHSKRKLNRQIYRYKKLEEYQCSFDDLFSFTNLYQAGKKCCNGSRWKSSTIYFENFLLRDTMAIFKELHFSSHKFKGFNSFRLFDHGKVRCIDALVIQDRAAHKCLCKYFLIDVLSRSFVYDSGASLKQKGMTFALKRIKQHLTKHFHKYGLNGGIYQFDLKNYFASIPHDRLKERVRKKVKDDRIYKLICDYIDDFQHMGANKSHSERKFGLGLGSEMSQILALDYATPIDHFIKDVLGVKGYGRYMDDGYIIGPDIAKLKEIKEKLYQFVESIGLKMSEKKNIITPFKNHSFVFLKMRFSLKTSGKVIMKVARKSIKAIQRKLKVFYRWMIQGLFDFEEICASYQAWRSYAAPCNSYKTIQSLDKYFIRLYRNQLAKRKLKLSCTIRAIKTCKGWKYLIK